MHTLCYLNILKYFRAFSWALHIDVKNNNYSVWAIIKGFCNHRNFGIFQNECSCTGKSLSEALPFSEHGENMSCTKIVLNVNNNLCTKNVLPRFELEIFMYWTCNSMNNLSSYCGLVDAKKRDSDKDLPVLLTISSQTGKIKYYKIDTL